MSQPPNFEFGDGLSPIETELARLHFQIGLLRAEFGLHEKLIQQLLTAEQRAQYLQNREAVIYASLDACFSGFADSDPKIAAQLKKLLEDWKKQNE